MKKNQFNSITLNKVIPPVLLFIAVILGLYFKHSFGLIISLGIVLILVFKVISNGQILNRVESENKQLLRQLKRQVLKNIETLRSERKLLINAAGSGQLNEDRWDEEICKFIVQKLSIEAIESMNIPKKEAMHFLLNYVNDLLFSQYHFNRINKAT